MPASSTQPLRVAPADRTRTLNYYHDHKEVMNLQSYLSKLNRSGREPQYAHLVAYQLYKGDNGKWCIPKVVKETMKNRAQRRREMQQESALIAQLAGATLAN